MHSGAELHGQRAHHRRWLNLSARSVPAWVRIAVGTLITERPPQSGRIEARTGLRMMPTFPRSPRSFRTARFPQYGWKAGLSGGAFPDRQRLKPAPGIRLLTAGLPSPFVHLRVGAVVPY